MLIHRHEREIVLLLRAEVRAFSPQPLSAGMRLARLSEAKTRRLPSNKTPHGSRVPRTVPGQSKEMARKESSLHEALSRETPICGLWRR